MIYKVFWNGLRSISVYQFAQLSQSDLNNIRLLPHVFIPSENFVTEKPGYVYTVGSSGLGYYLDLPLPDYTGEGDYSKVNLGSIEK